MHRLAGILSSNPLLHGPRPNCCDTCFPVALLRPLGHLSPRRLRVSRGPTSEERHDTDMAKSILVTGAAGFIGSNFVRWWLERHPDDHVVALDKLTYAGDPRNLDGLGVRLAVCDICDLDPTERLLAEEQINTVVNFAAESHNSLAVVDPGRF